MVRPILHTPAPVLRRRSVSVDTPTSADIQVLIQDLKDTCFAAEGIGLAAPQIGVWKSVAVINLPSGKPYGLANPKIVWKSARTSVLDEGCLSIPGLVVSVPRPTKVRVRALDESGALVEISAGDLLAKVLQHEIDHLNGILITDYTDKKKRL